MNTQFLRLLSLSAVVAVLTLAGCSSDDPTGPEPVPGSTIDAILAAAGKVGVLGAASDSVETWNDLQGNYRYYYERHDAIENLENVTCLGLNDDVIWPGSLVRGEHAYDYVYEPIVVARAPVTLSISLEGTGTPISLSEVVAAPSLSTVRQGISNLVSRALASNTQAPAQVDWSYERVYSASQMSLFADADIAYGAGSLSSSFDWSTESTTTKIMAKYTQVYYSIDMDTPAAPSAVVGEGLTVEQLRAAFPPGSMPMYVAGVKYGLMAIMCIETNFTMEQMSMALDASYSGIVDVDLGFGYSARDVMNSSTIRIIVYGGSTSGIEELNSFDGFLQIVSASTQFTAASTGVPILYKFRHLRDNTLAMISLTSNYTIVRPIRVRQSVRLTLDRITSLWSDDDDAFYDDVVDISSLHLTCNAYNRVGAADPGSLASAPNQAIYIWDGGDIEMPAGRWLDIGSSTDVVFNTEDYDFNHAKIDVTAWANDHDYSSANENGYGTLSILGNYMFGTKTVTIYNADFTLAFNMTIVLIP